uniref:Uncharacterized protein n=1 Tax=Anguilla anguilla TaxID=7936 RepID=A0A0E9SPX1_ANGAN
MHFLTYETHSSAHCGNCTNTRPRLADFSFFHFADLLACDLYFQGLANILTEEGLISSACIAQQATVFLL